MSDGHDGPVRGRGGLGRLGWFGGDGFGGGFGGGQTDGWNGKRLRLGGSGWLGVGRGGGGRIDARSRKRLGFDCFNSRSRKRLGIRRLVGHVEQLGVEGDELVGQQGVVGRPVRGRVVLEDGLPVGGALGELDVAADDRPEDPRLSPGRLGVLGLPEERLLVGDDFGGQPRAGFVEAEDDGPDAEARVDPPLDEPDGLEELSEPL